MQGSSGPPGATGAAGPPGHPVSTYILVFQVALIGSDLGFPAYIPLKHYTVVRATGKLSHQSVYN